MADKTSFKLIMGERILLLSLLPKEGDLSTIKILRKLRESLSPGEKEHSEYKFTYDFKCPDQDCSFVKIASRAPKCPEHKVPCIPSGKLYWDSKMADEEKEIWVGKKALTLIEDTLNKLNADKKLSDEDGTANLYEKFLGGEE